MRLNNRNAGFSLIEMVVSLLAAAILMLGVVTFISTSRTTYSVIGTSAKLQEEALVAENCFKEAIKEAIDYGCCDFNYTSDGFTAQVFCVMARDNEALSGYSLYYFILKKMNGEDIGSIYYKKENPTFTTDPNTGLKTNEQVNFYVDTSKTKFFSFNNSSFSDTIIKNTVSGIGSKYNLLVDNVKNLIISTPLNALGVVDAKGLLVNAKIEFEYNSTEYVANINSLSRNDSTMHDMG